MGNWLIGVYKDKLISVTDDERDNLWINLLNIRSSGFFQTHRERRILRPYFYLLSKLPIIRSKGKEGILKEYGLNTTPTAYAYSGLEPIKAYGEVEKDSFVLDQKAVSDSIAGLKNLLEAKKDLTPAQKEMRSTIEKIMRDKKLKPDSGKDLFSALKGLLEGGVCILALRTKEGTLVTQPHLGEREVYARGVVRTGTFFRVRSEGVRLILTPCRLGEKYLSGKGVLMGISDNPLVGTMDEIQAKDEMRGPTSKLCVKFYKKEWGDEPYYIVYREVSTDLRADMPIAMLKLASGFEEMFKNLGANVLQLSSKQMLYLLERNILLDGVMVDYADNYKIDLDNWENIGTLIGIKKEFHSILYTAALISVAGENALTAFADGRKGLERLNTKKSDEISKKYKSFFKCFASGAGDAIKYFQELEVKADLSYFFEDASP